MYDDDLKNVVFGLLRMGQSGHALRWDRHSGIMFLYDLLLGFRSLRVYLFFLMGLRLGNGLVGLARLGAVIIFASLNLFLIIKFYNYSLFKMFIKFTIINNPHMLKQLFMLTILVYLSSSRLFQTTMKFSTFGKNKGWIYLDKMSFAPGTV